MARDLSIYLQDVIDACTSFGDAMSGVSLEEYRDKSAVRSAVERKFIMFGEAPRRLHTLDEKPFGSLPSSRAIVDFRNLLAHDYGAIDDDLGVLGSARSHCGQVMARCYALVAYSHRRC
jgi:uncharacterized protein with HEPN domain